MMKHLQTFPGILSALALCAIVSCLGSPTSSATSTTNGASGTGTATMTIDGKTYSAGGWCGFYAGTASDNSADVIRIANSAHEDSTLTNVYQIMFQTAAQTPNTYSVSLGAPIMIIYYANGVSSEITLAGGTVKLTSVASASGQHTTGIFSGTYLDTNGTHQISNGSFDEVR